MSNQFIKDPDAVLDYAIDWTAWLADDTITTVTWLPVNDLTLTLESETDGVATVWISGGTLNERYEVTCRITTAAGRIDDRTIRISIHER